MTEQERQAALDALLSYKEHTFSNNEDAWKFLAIAIGPYLSTIEAALSSPAVPVIEGLDFELRAASMISIENWPGFQKILQAAIYYNALPKLQKVDLDGMKYIAPEETSIPYQATGYNRAIDDMKSKYGELYAEVK